MRRMLDLRRSAPGIRGAFSGDDDLADSRHRGRAQGLISVASNAMPRASADLVRRAGPATCALAVAAESPLLPFIDALFAEANPIPVKAVLAMHGHGAGAVRLPLLPATAALRQRLTPPARPTWRSRMRDRVRECNHPLPRWTPRRGARRDARIGVCPLQRLRCSGAVRAAARGEDGQLARQHLGQAGDPARLPAGPARSAGAAGPMRFFDKDTYSFRDTRLAEGVPDSVPAARRSAKARTSRAGVIMMPPSYVNVGAYRRRRDDDRFPRPGRLLRPGGQAGAPLGGRTARRGDRTRARCR